MPSTAKPSLRKIIKTLQAQITIYENERTVREDKMNKMAENMTHMMLRLEGVRHKMNWSVDQINQMGEEYLAKMSEKMDIQKATAAMEEASKLAVIRNPSTPSAPLVVPPAHYATDGAHNESPPADSLAPAGMPSEPVLATD